MNTKQSILSNCEEEIITKENGKINSGWLMFTDIFEKINGRWQAIFTNSSGIDD